MNIGNTDPKGKKKKSLRKTKETTKKIAVKRGKVGGRVVEWGAGQQAPRRAEAVGGRLN